MICKSDCFSKVKASCYGLVTYTESGVKVSIRYEGVDNLTASAIMQVC